MTKSFLALAVLGGLFSSAAFAGPVIDEKSSFVHTTIGSIATRMDSAATCYAIA